MLRLAAAGEEVDAGNVEELLEQHLDAHPLRDQVDDADCMERVATDLQKVIGGPTRRSPSASRVARISSRPCGWRKAVNCRRPTR
jgi:hypothetical protein